MPITPPNDIPSDRGAARFRAITTAVNWLLRRVPEMWDQNSGFQDQIDGKAAAVHGHTIANVAGLQASLDGKQVAGNYEAGGAVAAHVAASDPHLQYLTHAEGDVAYIPVGQKGAANGVAPLVAGIVPLANLPVLGGGSDPWTWQKLALDSVNSTVTLANVSGLSFTVLPLSTYLVQAYLPFQTAATTTGIAVALDVPTGATVAGLSQHAISTTAMGSVEQIADAATTGATTGVRAANARTLLAGQWLVITGATGGTVQLMMRSEIAASAATLKSGGIFGLRVI